MIVKEKVLIDEKDYNKTYSDDEVLINKVGTEELYDVAIDLPESEFEYVETDIPIEGGDIDE